MSPAIFAFWLIVVLLVFWLLGGILTGLGGLRPLARYVFCRWAPRWAHPTRNWGLAVAPEQPDHARGRRR